MLYDLQHAYNMQLDIYIKHLDACGGFAASAEFNRYVSSTADHCPGVTRTALGMQWLQKDFDYYCYTNNLPDLPVHTADAAAAAADAADDADAML